MGIDYFEETANDYRYKRLSSHPNGAGMQGFYKAYHKKAKEIYYSDADLDVHRNLYNGKQLWYKDVVEYKEYNISYEEALRSIYAVFSDYPLLYFSDIYNVFGNRENTKMAVCVDYEFIKGRFRSVCNDLIESCIEDVVVKISKTLSPRDKIFELCDYFKKHTYYDYIKGDTNFVDIPSHSILGFARNRSCVCEGFSKTLMAIANYLGIPTIIVSGCILFPLGNNPSDSGPHAWNMVKIDGRWYDVDITDILNGGVNCMNPGMKNNYVELPQKYINIDVYRYMEPFPKERF